MRLGSIFCLATAFTSALVTAAPAISTNEVVQVQARDAPSFNFELAARTMQELNEKAQQPGAFGKREDQVLKDLLDLMKSANLFDLFVEHLSRSAKVSETLSNQVLEAISNNRIQPDTIFSALNSKFQKRDVSEFDLDIEKRDLSDVIVKVVDVITSTGLVAKVLNYALTSPTVLQELEKLIVNVVQNVDWSAVLKAIILSGVISEVFHGVLSIFTGNSTTKREDFESFIQKRGLTDISSLIQKRATDVIEKRGIISEIVGYVVDLVLNSGIIPSAINYIADHPAIIKSIGNLLLKTVEGLDWSGIISAVRQVL